MFILGISLMSVGVGLIIGAARVWTINPGVRTALLIAAFALIVIGAVMDVTVVRRKNRQDAEARRENTLDGGVMRGVCPKCGLNVAKGTKICPNCKTELQDK